MSETGKPIAQPTAAPDETRELDGFVVCPGNTPDRRRRDEQPRRILPAILTPAGCANRR